MEILAIGRWLLGHLRLLHAVRLGRLTLWRRIVLVHVLRRRVTLIVGLWWPTLRRCILLIISSILLLPVISVCRRIVVVIGLTVVSCSHV